MALQNLEITLYSNEHCPYVHRALTVLRELSIPYKSVSIDLGTPREPWYLEINPRGTVPALSFTSPDYKNGETVIVNESLVIIYFLTDLFPSHLLPASNGGVAAAAERAQVAFFIDAWSNKVSSEFIKVVLSAAGEDESATNAAISGLVSAVEKEIEPLLKNKEGEGVFLGGKEKFTLAEVVAAPFILRNFLYADEGILPASLKEKLLALPNFGKWASEVVKNESLLAEFPADTALEKVRKRLAQIKAGTFKPKV